MRNHPTLPRWLTGGLLGIILIAAASLRFSHADWDGGYQLHPDERSILFAAQEIRLPHSLPEPLEARRSPLNPYRDKDGNERLFAYGSLPLYSEVMAQRALSALCRWPAFCANIVPASFAGRLTNSGALSVFDQLTFVGRAVSALFDTLTVLAVYLLAAEVFDSAATGLLASALLAGAVIHIQNAHFGTVDPPLAFFCTLSIWWAARYSRSRSPADSILAGVAAGLAIGCKAAGLLLVIPLILVHLQPQVPVVSSRDLRMPGLRAPATLAWTAAVLILSFVLTNPYALLDPTAFVDSLGLQMALFSGAGRPTFVLQYSGTLPIIYSLDQLARWGLGLPLALITLVGLGWAARRALQSRSSALLVVVGWAAIAGVVLSSSAAKFPRYLLPVTPALIVLAAGFLTIPRLLTPGWRIAISGIILAVTGANALAFNAMYDTPHPWLAASRWIYQNVPPESTLVDELNDDALPLDMAGADGYHVRDLTYQAQRIDPLALPDDCAKISAIAQAIAGSDYLILASDRLYGVAPRLGNQYPLTTSYYSHLMSGALGFELLRSWSRYPNLAGWSLVDDPFGGLAAPTGLSHGTQQIDIGPVDQSFTVYDHPLVLLFENRQRLTATRIRQIIVNPPTCP